MQENMFYCTFVYMGILAQWVVVRYIVHLGKEMVRDFSFKMFLLKLLNANDVYA